MLRVENGYRLDTFAPQTFNYQINAVQSGITRRVPWPTYNLFGGFGRDFTFYKKSGDSGASVLGELVTDTAVRPSGTTYSEIRYYTNPGIDTRRHRLYVGRSGSDNSIFAVFHDSTEVSGTAAYGIDDAAGIRIDVTGITVLFWLDSATGESLHFFGTGAVLWFTGNSSGEPVTAKLDLLADTPLWLNTVYFGQSELVYTVSESIT